MVDRDTAQISPEQQGITSKNFIVINDILCDIAEISKRTEGDKGRIREQIQGGMSLLEARAKACRVNGRDGEADMLRTVALGLRLSDADWHARGPVLDRLAHSGAFSTKLTGLVMEFCSNMDKSNRPVDFANSSDAFERELTYLEGHEDARITPQSARDARLLVSTVLASSVGQQLGINEMHYTYGKPGSPRGIGRFVEEPPKQPK